MHFTELTCHANSSCIFHLKPVCMISYVGIFLVPHTNNVSSNLSNQINNCTTFSNLQFMCPSHVSVIFGISKVPSPMSGVANLVGFCQGRTYLSCFRVKSCGEVSLFLWTLWPKRRSHPRSMPASGYGHAYMVGSFKKQPYLFPSENICQLQFKVSSALVTCCVICQECKSKGKIPGLDSNDNYSAVKHAQKN